MLEGSFFYSSKPYSVGEFRTRAGMQCFAIPSRGPRELFQWDGKSYWMMYHKRLQWDWNLEILSTVPNFQKIRRNEKLKVDIKVLR